MSLQVWLPLTGDLHNQGLSGDREATVEGTTSFGVGKIGSALSCNAASYWIVNGVTLGSEASICCWVKTTANGKMPWVLESDANVLLNFYWASIYTLNTGDSNNNPFKDESGNTIAILNDGEWHHFVVTFGSSIAKLYIDGEYAGTATTFRNPTTTNKAVKIGGGYRNQHAYDWSGLINDFRVYDHCLSAKEIKKISQGFVLHYPLSDEYIESTTNLVTTEDGLSNTCYNGATSKYNYGTNTDMYKTLGVFENRKSTKVYMGTTGLDAYPYVYFDAFNAAGTTVQTLSFNYFPTLQNTIIPYSYNGTYNFSYTTNKTSGSSTNVSQIIIPVEVGKWNHITITAQKYDTTNTSRGIGYIRIGSAKHTSNTSNYWLFNNVQVEKKDHATGYAGVGGTRNSNVVYDSSGFCNNGTAIGTLTISDNIPKYSCSTYFASGNNYIDCGASQEILPRDGLTVSLWTNYSTWGNPISCTEGGGWNFENSSGIQFPVYIAGVGYKVANSGVATSTLQNGWHMLTGTFDKTNVKIYIDGVLKATTATSSTNGIGYAANHCYVGAEAAGSTSIASAGFIGKISDVRIYATALSADDIKSLYQNGATIDANGTIHGQIR